MNVSATTPARTAGMTRTLFPIFITVFIAAVGYGISFPLLGSRLDLLALPGWMIGVNGAAPALGWILGSALIPFLQFRWHVRIGTLALAFLLCAALALVGLRYADTFTGMTVLRFFFGGGIGLFFRCVEYCVNGLSRDDHRALNLSINWMSLMSGLAIGAAAQPELGHESWVPFGAILGTLIGATAAVATWPRLARPTEINNPIGLSWACVAALPVAFIAAFAYGLYEAIPAYLNQMYALRNGLPADIAAYAVTAAALGLGFGPVPVAILSDRIGRRIPLLICAAVGMASSLVMPWALTKPELFLANVALSAGAAGACYGLALAMIGDRFRDAALVTANAAFGSLYAAANVIGPLVNGAALDTFNSQGMMMLSALTFASLALTVMMVKPGPRAVTQCP